MKNLDYEQDIEPRAGGPLLAPDRVNRRVNHVNAVDWSNCPLAQRYRITGETDAGPYRVAGRTVWRTPRARAA